MIREQQVKICGMREPVNIQQVASLYPDFMGFIFYEKSPRYVGSDFTVPENFPSGIKKVGVFVNASKELITSTCEKLGLKWVQLHGHESVEYVADLQRTGLKIVKAFSVDDEFDFNKTTTYAPYVSYFLFDTKGKNFGGNGQRFNWSLLYKYKGTIPFFLSGGIGLEHMAEIKSIQHPMFAGIDVNSGVEEVPGKKNLARVQELIQQLTK